MRAIELSTAQLAELVSVREIESLIATGRSKARKCGADPYAGLAKPQVARAIHRDARSIFNWYQRKVEQGRRKQVAAAYEQIAAIEQGPRLRAARTRR